MITVTVRGGRWAEADRDRRRAGFALRPGIDQMTKTLAGFGG